MFVMKNFAKDGQIVTIDIWVFGDTGAVWLRLSIFANVVTK